MLTRKCASTRIPSWFSFKGSRESTQKMRGVTSPQAHQKQSEPSRVRFQLGDETPGTANSRPRPVHKSAAAIQRAHRLLNRQLFDCHPATARRSLISIAKGLLPRGQSHATGGGEDPSHRRSAFSFRNRRSCRRAPQLFHYHRPRGGASMSRLRETSARPDPCAQRGADKDSCPGKPVGHLQKRMPREANRMKRVSVER